MEEEQGSRLPTLRLLVEIVVILVVCEAMIMVILPALVPGVSAPHLAIFDALLIAGLCGPLILWRLGRLRGGPDLDPRPDELTSFSAELGVKVALDRSDRRRAGVEAIAAGLLVGAVAVIALLGAVKSAELAVTEKFSRDLGSLAAVAASSIDLEVHDRITEPGLIDGPDYLHAIAPLRRITQAVPELKYLYTVVQDGPTIRFVLDAAEPGDNDQDGIEDRSQVWEAYADADEGMHRALRAASWIGRPGEADPGIVSSGKPYSDKWGTFVSAYAPVRRADGSVAAVVGLDVSAEHFEATTGKARLEAIVGGVPAALMILVGVTGFYLARRKMLGNEAHLRSVLSRSERLAEIAQRSHNAVVITDARGKIEWVNPGFTRMSGYELEEVRGRTPGSFLRGELTDPEQSALIKAALEGREPVSVELVNYAKSGRPYMVQVDIQALNDRNGGLKGYMAIQSDVTEKHEAQQKIVAAMRAAECANEAKGEFLANMSHEIRSPLTAILGYADLLGNEADLADDAVRRGEAVRAIQGAGRHLLAILNDILDISKIDAGRMTVERIETDLPATLLEVVQICRSRAQEKNVELQLRLTDEIPERIHSDPTRLRQILFNLIGNAIKFTAEGGVVVRVGRTENGDSLEVAIEDTGPGLSSAQAERLFQPFNQADASVTRRHGGTGLGLVISRRLARLMGGDVVLARSELGKGATFVVAVPLEPVSGSGMVTSLEAAPPPVEVTSPVIKRQLTGRFLIAEDGPDNQLILSRILRKAGAEVEVADNGRIALEMIATSEREGRPFDLLLSDMQMPEMDGYSLARHLREIGSKLPIIALTAHAMTEDREKCLDAGCDDYVSKPIDRPILLETCARLLHLPLS